MKIYEFCNCLCEIENDMNLQLSAVCDIGYSVLDCFSVQPVLRDGQSFGGTNVLYLSHRQS